MSEAGEDPAVEVAEQAVPSEEGAEAPQEGTLGEAADAAESATEEKVADEHEAGGDGGADGEASEEDGEEEEDEEEDDEDDEEEELQDDSFDDDEDDMMPEYDITLNGLSSYLHALDLGIDLPTVDLTNQGIGDQGIIDLLNKLVETDKLSSVCTLKLDGNDIEVDGACKLAECLITNNTITFVDLKWNLIGVDGTSAIGKALEVNTTLVSLNLDGNELGEEGAEALALSLMKNRGLKYLELKDNTIGDVGACALAYGLASQTDMVLLDLTSNDIGKVGATAIAHHLVGPQAEYEDLIPEDSPLKAEGAGREPSYTLETLILNNNSIGDAGAIALGSALLENASLHSLQLRKCGIYAEGVVAITKALTEGNEQVTELDMNANQCGVTGEIALNDMMMSKPDLYVEWKDVTQESSWDVNQIQEIIQHYGVSEILSNILRGFSLVPLIENYKLLGALEIEDQQTADEFVSTAFSEENLLHGLSMVITILNQGEEEEEDLFDEVMVETEADVEQLTPLLRSIHGHMQTLKEKLVTNDMEVIDYACGQVRPFGEARLKILSFITSLVRQNTTAISKRMIELGFPLLFMNLLAQYPLNNILHNEVVRFVHAALRVTDLRVAICSKEHGLLDALIDRSVEEWEKPLNERGGFSGHLAIIARAVSALEVDGSDVMEGLSENEDWQAFVTNDLTAYTEQSQWSETYV
eukprot:TRINITY_DN2848_c2_g1_i1.p1 TRINITY_DN2848_c2_g1~~TRINITY_DN2848_c2_g1_i1.p1  ORF type:complete len:699 (+),score=305.63 TRINITY_DN2848_c2_g1_i1:206-2302(+)